MKLQHPFRTAFVATLGVGLGIILLESVQTLSTILLYVGTALFLSLGLDPIISWLTRRKLPRWAAVLITIVSVLGAFAGLVVMVVPIIVGQITQLVTAIQEFLFSRTLEEFLSEATGWLQGIFPAMEPQMLDDALAYVQDWVLDNWGTITGEVIAVGFNMIAVLTGAFIVLILTVYLTASTPSLKASVYQLVPASRRPRFVDLSEQITDSVGYYVMGQVSLGLINGVLSAIFLSIIQAPFPAVLAVIAFFFSLIPLVGTLTGSTIIVLMCLLGSPQTAVIALIYYAIYMQIEAYVLSPRIMNRAVSVPGAVVVVAALAGGSLLGLLGALIAIPVAASILIIYRQVLIPRQNER